MVRPSHVGGRTGPACFPPCDAPDDCDGCWDEDPVAAGCEPLEQACSTDCGNGTEQCFMGEWRGCTAPQPQDETPQEVRIVSDHRGARSDPGPTGGGRGQSRLDMLLGVMEYAHSHQLPR